MDLSIVIPLYNEADSLSDLTAWIDEVMQSHGFTYEVIFIDDGSTDNSWPTIRSLAEKFPAVRGVSFQRNYGKSAGLHTGFQMANGDVVITMDADLQDSPEEIPAFYNKLVEGGYDLISGWKQKRYDPITKTLPTKLFNFVTAKLTGISLHDFNCGLKAYRRTVVKHIEVYGEMHRYIPVIAKWTGFGRIGEKVVQHRPRKFGASKFGIERFINGFLDLLSILFVARFSKKPMHLFGTLGTLMFGIGVFITLALIVNKLLAIYVSNTQFREVVDQPLFYLALTAVIIGTQLFLAGFLAELISRNRDPSERNVYAIKDSIQA